MWAFYMHDLRWGTIYAGSVSAALHVYHCLGLKFGLIAETQQALDLWWRFLAICLLLYVKVIFNLLGLICG